MPVSAGQGILLGPVLFSPSAQIGYDYDSNVFNLPHEFLVERDPDGTGTSDPVRRQLKYRIAGDRVVTARAKLTFKLPFSHSYASLSLSPQYRAYGTSISPSRSSYLLESENRLNFSNGSSVLIKESYLDGFADLRTEVDSPGNPFVVDHFEFSSVPYQKNHPTIDYDWTFASGWGIAGRVDHTDFTTGSTKVVDLLQQSAGGSTGERTLFDFFDYATNIVEARGYRSFSLYQLFASVRFGRTNQNRTKYNDSREALTDCSPEPPDVPLEICSAPDHEQILQADAGFGIKGNLFYNSRGQLEIDYARWGFRTSEAPPFSGLAISGKLEHTFDRMMTGYLNIDRTPVQATGSITGYYIAERFEAGVERKLTMQLKSRASVDVRKARFPGSNRLASDRFSLTEYSGNLEVNYRPGQALRSGPLLLTVSYKPELSRSTREDLRVSDQRLGFSLQYGWF